MRGGHVHLGLALTSVGILACLPLLFYLFNKLSKRPAELELYRDCIVLTSGRNRAEIAWADLPRLSVYNEHAQASKELSSKRGRKIYLNVPHERLACAPTYLLIDADPQDRKLVQWIRDRATQQRHTQTLERDSV